MQNKRQAVPNVLPSLAQSICDSDSEPQSDVDDTSVMSELPSETSGRLNYTCTEITVPYGEPELSSTTWVLNGSRTPMTAILLLVV